MFFLSIYRCLRHGLLHPGERRWRVKSLAPKIWVFPHRPAIRLDELPAGYEKPRRRLLKRPALILSNSRIQNYCESRGVKRVANRSCSWEPMARLRNGVYECLAAVDSSSFYSLLFVSILSPPAISFLCNSLFVNNTEPLFHFIWNKYISQHTSSIRALPDIIYLAPQWPQQLRKSWLPFFFGLQLQVRRTLHAQQNDALMHGLA